MGECRTVRDSHVGHFVERKVMPIFEEDRENPRMRFIRSEQSHDIFAAGPHVAIRAKRPGYLASFLTKVAVTFELRKTVTELVALPVPPVTSPDHSLKTKLAAGLATSVTVVSCL